MKTETVHAMLRRSRTSPKLFGDCNTLQFASVMGIVVFVVLLFLMTAPTNHHAYSADLPRILHPVAMRGALQEDAMKLTITRHGQIFFGSEQVCPDSLGAKIQQRLSDRGVERKVYVMADFRARWDRVELALDGVRSAGIVRVAFLVN